MYNHTIMNSIVVMVAPSVILISSIIFTPSFYNVDKVFAQTATTGSNSSYIITIAQS